MRLLCRPIDESAGLSFRAFASACRRLDRYPKLPSNTDNLNVRVIEIQANDSSDGHPAPDPWLLISKAVAVLQKRHGFDIVEPTQPEDDEQNHPSNSSIQAEEEYLRLREERLAPTSMVGRDITIPSVG